MTSTIMPSEWSGRLASTAARIAAYTAEHPELLRAHHFLYDIKRPPERKPEFVVLGVNLGESELDWKIASEPTEESSRYDFHVLGPPVQSAVKWAAQCDFYLYSAPYVLAEVFLWSSRSIKELEDRWGPLEMSPHLAFCRAMNLELFAAYAPKAVVAPGLGMQKLCASLYSLKLTDRTLKVDGATLARVYTDDSRPWIFTRHWTGAFGFSQANREQLRHFIQQTCA